jgi:hypothetical protein
LADTFAKGGDNLYLLGFIEVVHGGSYPSLGGPEAGALEN